MKKAELINRVRKDSGFDEATVRKILDTTSSVMIGALASGDKPYGLGLGRFTTIRRPAKKARDIRRGTAVDVPERNSVHFKPSLPLVEAVNGKREI